jgi:hypothetical protein
MAVFSLPAAVAGSTASCRERHGRPTLGAKSKRAARVHVRVSPGSRHLTQAIREGGMLILGDACIILQRASRRVR